MIKLEQKGFTIVEMLISIAILGIVAPLLVVALFQILTFTERSRAGFEAQADTRVASGWMSQDIVMAQETNLIDLADISPFKVKENQYCISEAEADWATFTWTDLFEDRNTEYTVSYCLIDSEFPPPESGPFPKCREPGGEEHGICLVRNFSVIDSDGNPVGDPSRMVIARNIVSVKFQATIDAPEREISVTIKSAPQNRFGAEDEKTFKVLMRPTI